jgi:hypothetical protein
MAIIGQDQKSPCQAHFSGTNNWATKSASTWAVRVKRWLRK